MTSMATTTRADLRRQAKAAVEHLGLGYLTHPANEVLRQELVSGQTTDLLFQRDLIRVFYRLLIDDLSNGKRPPDSLLWSSRLLDSCRIEDEVTEQMISILTDQDLTPEPADLGAIYEFLLEQIAELSISEAASDCSFLLRPAEKHDRKASGSYYTPQALVEALIDTTLEPAIKDQLARVPEEEHYEALLQLRICDPACGSGNFLVAAGRRLARHLASLDETRTEPSEHGCQIAFSKVVDRCLHGVDLDPMAAELCRLVLWLESNCQTFPERIVCGNSLIGCTPELLQKGIPDDAFTAFEDDDRECVKQLKKKNSSIPDGLYAKQDRNTTDRLTCDAWCASFVWIKDGSDCATCCPVDADLDSMLTDPAYDTTHPQQTAEVKRLAADYQFLHWHLAFPDVFDGSPQAGFDVILGNPPFLNQLESATVSSRRLSQLLKYRTDGVIRGYTDLSATFLQVSSELLRPKGRMSLVQPQSLLAARDAKPARQAILKKNSLTDLWVSNEHVFEDANVYTCVPTLQADGPRQVKLKKTTRAGIEPLPSEVVDMDTLSTQETWSQLAAAANGLPDLVLSEASPLSEIAEATADFRDQFYGLDGFLIETSAIDPDQLNDEAFPRIVTTGLIDLAELKWGATTTRILKTKWEAPRVDRQGMEERGELGYWLTNRLVPKVLMATQTRIVEVIADAEGELIPSLPLITIMPRNSDDLWRIAAAVASPVTSLWALRMFAGAALHADAIKLSAKQTALIPLPIQEQAWNESAELFQQAQHAEDAESRVPSLKSYATRIVEAYGLDRESQQEILDWWLARAFTEA